LSVEPTLPRIPAELSGLLGSIRAGFPMLLADNLVGIYLWGSLTYDAFDERCSDVDSVVVTRRDLNDKEFAALEKWFAASMARNRWTARLDMRFVIDGEFLDEKSRCCGIQESRFKRYGSDGNPLIWLNIKERGVTLWGREAKRVAPDVPQECLGAALLRELDYLRRGLAKFAGHRSVDAFRYNAYAVLTACRIMYTARHRTVVSKEQAYRWALDTVTPELRRVAAAARRNRLDGEGQTTPELERDAAAFVRFAEERIRSAPASAVS
jgi:predicted nucleotidyltransferase